MENIDIKPLSGTIGAEMHGIDLALDLSDDTVKLIRAALLEYHVLFFPNKEPISVERHIKMARHFGEIQTTFPSFAAKLDGHPEVVYFDGGRPGGRASKWHTDVSVSKAPPLGSIIHIRELPVRGGDTMWADTCAAFDALSPMMQGILEKMTVVHDMFTDEYRNRPDGFDPSKVTVLDYSVVPRAEHPLVRVHPESGRKCLFINPFFTSHILGLDPAESAHLLRYLFDHMQKPEFICRRHWSKNEICFWDNRCTMHSAVNDYGEGSRLVHRVSIAGDTPFGV